VGVETACALRAEQVRGSNIALAQYQVQVRMPALRTGFAHGTESCQAHRRTVVIGMIDHDAPIQLGQVEVVISVVPAPALDREGRGFRGRRFKDWHTHSIDSLCFKKWLM
jgi:hypothetical protein